MKPGVWPHPKACLYDGVILRDFSPEEPTLSEVEGTQRHLGRAGTRRLRPELRRTIAATVLGRLAWSVSFDIVLAYDPDRGDCLKRRVVITGMGTVSPNGIGNAAFSAATLAGKSGIRRITRFDPSEIPVQIAGEVADFDELAWVDKRERKHVSRVLPLALAAATEALRTAGIDAPSLPLEKKRRFGVILGSGGGSQEFTEEQYRLFFHQQYNKMSLFCVPTGVMGTLSSELSVRFGLRGPSHVVTTGCTSSTDGFGYAVRQIRAGRLDMVLSGGADAPISLGIVKGFVLMKILTDSWNHAPERGSQAVFRRPRWLRGGRGSMDVCARRI